MTFWKHFKAKSCSVQLDGTTKEEILASAVRMLVEGGALRAELEAQALAALVARERTGSTGVGTSVAIPHVKLSGLDRVACGVGLCVGGVEWAAVDGQPVQILFVVLRPDRAGDHHDPDKHLEMMRWIARLARDADFRNFALRVKSKAELVDLLKEKSAV
jgi:nitrogen PTS system EIIA component